MIQNTSSAVMAQRKEPHDSLDNFPTPPWAARALCEHVIAIEPDETCLEPACGKGFLVRGLREHFSQIYKFDIHDYGENRVQDFLFPGPMPVCEWVITNPPFRLAEQFIWRAFECATKGIAMLVRTQFLESKGRFERLFSKERPLIVAQFVERVPMVKGRCDPKASTASSYCWIVWSAAESKPSIEPTEFMWVPPCRKLLEREGDYDLQKK